MKHWCFLLYALGLLCIPKQAFAQVEPDLATTEKVGTIALVGNADGCLGFIPRDPVLGYMHLMCFDRKNNLYIDDPLNKRILVYDNNYKYYKKLPVFGGREYMRISEDDYIMMYDSNYIKAFSPEGVLDSFVDMRDEVKTDEYASYHIQKLGNLFFWETRNGELKGIDNPGLQGKANRLNTINGSALLSKLLKAGTVANVSSSGSSDVKDALDIPARPLVQGTKIIMNGTTIPTSIKHILSQEKLAMSGSNGYNRKAIGDERMAKIYSSPDSAVFIMKDVVGNTYWEWGESYIVILDSKGVLIKMFDAFAIQTRPAYSNMAVSADGDIFYLKKTETSFELWKIVRTW